jgi:hypothetical protein
LREIASIAFTNIVEFLNNDLGLKALNEFSLDKVGAIDNQITELDKIEGRTKTLSSNLNAKLKSFRFL